MDWLEKNYSAEKNEFDDWYFCLAGQEAVDRDVFFVAFSQAARPLLSDQRSAHVCILFFLCLKTVCLFKCNWEHESFNCKIVSHFSTFITFLFF